MRLLRGGYSLTEKQLSRAAAMGDLIDLRGGYIRAEVIRRLVTDGERGQLVL